MNCTYQYQRFDIEATDEADFNWRAGAPLREKLDM